MSSHFLLSGVRVRLFGELKELRVIFHFCVCMFSIYLKVSFLDAEFTDYLCVILISMKFLSEISEYVNNFHNNIFIEIIGFINILEKLSSLLVQKVSQINKFCKKSLWGWISSQISMLSDLFLHIVQLSILS